MDDISNGRINCENLTDEEWRLLELLNKIGEWYVPTDAQWLAVRGILGMVDVRRGYKPTNDGAQFGWPNIRINTEGAKALSFRRNGKVYSIGRPMQFADALKHPIVVTCKGCDGTGFSDRSQREHCMDCAGVGYLGY